MRDSTLIYFELMKRIAKRLKYCKIYSEEEIALLNNLIVDKDVVEEEVIDVSKQNKCLDLPSLDGSIHEAQLIWIQHVQGNYYLASLRYTGDSFKDPYADGYTEWMIKLDKEVGFVPLFCSLHWEETK